MGWNMPHQVEQRIVAIKARWPHIKDFNKLYAMDMPHIETLEQAKHFIRGPKAYAGAHSPWTKPITSFQRPEAPQGEDVIEPAVRLVGAKA